MTIGTWTRQLAGMVGLALALGVPGLAQAAVNGSWVLNGSTVTYDGGWDLRIGAGEVNVNNANDQLASAVVNVDTPAGIIWAGVGAGNCPTATQNLLSANSPFYVYYEPSGPQLLVSPVAPTEDGVPSGALFWNPGTGCNGGISPVNFVYLGSFVTSGGSPASIVPFQRFGDQVRFLNAGGNSNPSGIAVSFTSSTQTSVNLSGGANNWAWPTTASALHVEILITNTDSDKHSISILDPTWGQTELAIQCSSGDLQFDLAEYYPVAATSQMGLLEFPWTPSTANSDMEVSACDSAWGAGTLTATLYLRGYTEAIHHLDVPR